MATVFKALLGDVIIHNNKTYVGIGVSIMDSETSMLSCMKSSLLGDYQGYESIKLTYDNCKVGVVGVDIDKTTYDRICTSSTNDVVMMYF